MKVLTNLDVMLLAAWHVLVRTVWAGAVILIVMLFDGRTQLAAKFMAAGAVMLVVWAAWFVLTVWMAKSGIPKSAQGAGYASLSAGAKAKLIAGYSGF